MMRRYAQLPNIVNGATIDDIFAIVVPVARTNEVTNPSGETNTTGYTAGAGTLTRSTEQQYHGAYSFKYVPGAAVTDGFYYTLTTSIALRAISCKFLGAKGVPYTLAYATTAPADLGVYSFVATGRWQWIWLYINEASATTRRIYFRKNNSASAAIYYVDGVQSEVLASAAETVSTYIDGDQPGLVPNQQPPAYLWIGTPHASSSQRSGLTRAGGMIVKLKDFSFFLTAIVGLGLAVPQNVSTEYARIDGAYDDYTRKPTRQFSLAGQFQGRSYQELRSNRSEIAQLLDRDLIGLDQRMTLLHHIEGPCGDVQTNESRILCKYQGGLGGNTDNHHGESAALSFEQYMPFVVSDGEAGSALSVQLSITNANRILQRSPTGVWRALGTGGDFGVLTLLIGADGALYAGGAFTLMDGVANTSRIAKWDGSAWSALGTGANAGSVGSLALAPDGSIYAGGTFTLMGGVANTSEIAKWNGSAWSALGTGSATGSVFTIAVASNGDVYAGGTFNSMGGVANTLRLAKWNGSAWSALGTGANGTINRLVFGPDGNLYAGGDFTSIGGTAINRVAKFDGTTWTSIGTGGANAAVNGLTFGLNGLLYAVGSFTSIGGVAISNAAVWNGTTWSPLGAGLNNTPLGTATAPNGNIAAFGTFTASGVVTFPDRIALWNGATWLPLDVDLPGAPNIGYVCFKNDGTFTVAYDTGGTAVAAATTTVTNTGTAKTYPTVRIAGPSSGTSRIFQILNTTTGRAIYLNYTISAGETAILQFTPDNLSFVSSFVGNIANTILPGSNEADFFLQPGANVISFYSADSTVTAVLYWRPLFANLDNVP